MAQVAAKNTEVLGQQLRLFERCEVTVVWHLCPALGGVSRIRTTIAGDDLKHLHALR